MKKRKQRKPTMSQVEVVVGNLIKESQNLKLSLMSVQRVLSDYIDFKKDKEKFTKYVEDINGRKNKRNNKNSNEKK